MLHNHEIGWSIKEKKRNKSSDRREEIELKKKKKRERIKYEEKDFIGKEKSSLQIKLHQTLLEQKEEKTLDYFKSTVFWL